MTTSIIRVATTFHQKIKSMAKEQKSSMQLILNKALYEYENILFFQEANRGYERLKRDPKAWAEELAERKIFEGTLMDDIDEE